MSENRRDYARVLAALGVRGIYFWGVNLVSAGITTSSALAGGLLLWYAIRPYHHRDWQIIGSAWKWGLIIGGTGFAIGFFGPIILSWGAQGPLIGIFITGPISFSIGVVMGLIISILKITRQKSL